MPREGVPTNHSTRTSRCVTRHRSSSAAARVDTMTTTSIPSGLNANHSSDEEEEEYAVASALDRDAPLDASLKKVLRRTEEEIEERRAIESAVDAREWKLELERGTFIYFNSRTGN